MYIICFGISSLLSPVVLCNNSSSGDKAQKVFLFSHNCIFLKFLFLALNSNDMAVCVAQIAPLLNALSHFFVCCDAVAAAVRLSFSHAF